MADKANANTKKGSIWDELAAPFPPELIHWRIGRSTADKTRSMVLAYIDARDVFDRLDEVVGPENWQTHIHMGPDGRAVCAMEIRDPERGTWITKSDGAGATAVEGEKGGISDAIKRAFVQFGGCRYLYRLDSPWVRSEPKGKSAIIAPEEHERLRIYLESGVRPQDQKGGEAPPPENRPRATQGAKSKSAPPPAPSGDPGAKATKEELKPLWKLNFQAVEAVYGKEGAEDHKFEAMDYVVARMGKDHTNQIKKGDLAQMPAFFEEWKKSRNTGQNAPSQDEEPPPPDDEYGDAGPPF